MKPSINSSTVFRMSPSSSSCSLYPTNEGFDSVQKSTTADHLVRLKLPYVGRPWEGGGNIIAPSAAISVQ